MASVDDAARMASDLPEVTDGERHGHRTWFVHGKAFAWVRPFSKADVKRFGDAPVPDGPILAVATVDLEDKQGVLEEGARGVFTISHFDGYAAVLVQLPIVAKNVLRDLIVDAWLAKAPPALADEYLARSRRRRSG